MRMDKEKLKRRFTTNLDIKLIALVLSFFLWLYLKLSN